MKFRKYKFIYFFAFLAAAFALNEIISSYNTDCCSSKGSSASSQKTSGDDRHIQDSFVSNNKKNLEKYIKKDLEIKNSFSNSYKSIDLFHLTEENQKFKHYFNGKSSIVSVLIKGKKGSSHIGKVLFELADGTRVEAIELSGDYFKNDWYRFESKGKLIKSIEFIGHALKPKSSIEIIVQRKLKKG